MLQYLFPLPFDAAQNRSCTGGLADLPPAFICSRFWDLRRYSLFLSLPLPPRVFVSVIRATLHPSTPTFPSFPPAQPRFVFAQQNPLEKNKHQNELIDA